MQRYILISNVSQSDIASIKTEIEKKKKLTLNMVSDQKEEANRFSNFPPDYGFIFSTNCDDKIYKSVLNMNNRKIRKVTNPIIISFPENFNEIYEAINFKFFSEHSLEYSSNRVIDLSNLAKKVNIPCNFNSISFAQTLYFLCYKFQSCNNLNNDGIDINKFGYFNELNLDNDEIDINGFCYFNDLKEIFFPRLKKVYIRKHSFKLPEIEPLLSIDIEYFFYENYVYLIARQTDLKKETIEKFIEDHNLRDSNMPFITNEIQKNANNFQPSDYNSNEAYNLHQLKPINK